jgi:cation diffusion facilitator CzcD-associated flavoprotein CzcO
MPGGVSYYPTRDEALAYLADYESRYAVPVIRPVRVAGVTAEAGGLLRVRSESNDDWLARAVVSATGTWSMPNVPSLPGQDRFGGTVVHSARYASPDPFVGRRVVVVGGGNSGAQIVADLFGRATVTWATLSPPTFLPDDVDGRYLFGEASARYRALTDGGTTLPPRSLGDIVMVESVRRARDDGALNAVPMFTGFTESGVVWPDGRQTQEDAVIFATGFRPALAHLGELGVMEPNGRLHVRGTRSIREPKLWLVGYGDWTGYASATLIGVGRTARATVDEIVGALRRQP